MRNKLFLLFIVMSFYALPSVAQQGIFINEVMASNDNTIADSTGEYEDWIEVYNSSSTTFLLDGYYLSNDRTNPTKFRFSGNVEVPANGYLVLWASGDIARGKTHISFKVSASGTGIYLYLPDGATIADSILFGQQKTDISYGRQTDGAVDLSFFSSPSPGATNNNSTGYAGILNTPIFSTAAGFYPDPFTLNLSSDDPGARIVYTLDGSYPDTGNVKGTVYRYKNKYPQNPGDVGGPFLYDSFRSVMYVNPLQIKDASVNPNRLCIKSSTYDNAVPYYFPATPVNKGTIVRAIAVRNGYISSEINTATYFVSPGGKNKYTLPVISLAIPENQLYSWDSGVYNAGTDFEKWRTDNPTAPLIGGGEPANWRRDTEFPSSFEMFTANKANRELQYNTGWSLNGNWSRSKPQKAFRIYFRSSYGASDINYPIFPETPYSNYERLLLSNSGQDMNSTHIRDMIIETSVQHLRFEIEHARPSIAFLNGEFWGLLNIKERYDDNFFDQKYGIKKEELDFLENRSTVKYGTSTEINNLRNFFSANDLSTSQNYQAVQNQMDIDNFIDYHITEIFFGNNDWPANNVEYFRKRTPYTPGAPKGHDGRWRWVACDMDRGLGTNGSGGVQYNSLAWATGTRTDVNPPVWATDMLRKLLTNINFRNQFITRYADLINTTFLPANINSVINYYRDLVTPHIAEHLERWRRPVSASAWNDTVNNMIQYATQRPFYATQHLREQFSLSNEQQLTIDVSDSAQGYICVNTIDITPAFPGVPKQAYPWKGLYYPEVPVTLIAKAKPGYRFTHWEGEVAGAQDTLTVTLSRAMSFKAFFEKTEESSKVFDYWHFNKLPAGTLTSVAADTSLTGNAFITYDGTGNGYIDGTGGTEGSTLNTQFNNPSGVALRPRNPSAGRALLINAPSTGYKNIQLVYATSRTTKGAEYQRIFYYTDNVWILKTDSIVVSSPETNFGLQTIDFSTDTKTADNPKFAVRIEFFGNNSTATSGNDRFDNITVSGIPLFKSTPPPTLSVSSDKNSVCTNSKVTFTATALNIPPSPVFQWIKNGVNVGNNSNIYVDNSFQNKDTVYCILTVSDTSIKSNKIIITVIPNYLVIASLTKTAPSACGDDGTITINKSGGTLPYQYSLNNVNYFSGNSFTNLGPGTYTAFVEDAKGCRATLSDVLTRPAQLVITSLTKTSASACNVDGKITINRTGGTSPYQYSLNNVDYFAANIFTNLAAGTYTAYVRDGKGCTATLSDVITKPAALVITALTKTSPSACVNDGKIIIYISGGSSPYQYSLNNVDYFSSNTFSNLSSGTYTAYVKDSKGCTATYADVLTRPSAPVITSLGKTAPSACKSDGQITIYRSGGSSPFLYSLNGTDYFSTNVFSNLAGGAYTAYLKDGKGCIATFSDALTKPSPLIITSISKTAAAACKNDGQIIINRSGGSSPYQFSLNNVDYLSTNTFTNLAAATYTSYVKDAKGCTATLSDVLTKASTLVITSLSKTAASACSADGKITVNISGGTSPYQYSLNNVDYFTTNAFSNLAAGSYKAYVKDARGCTATISDVLAKASALVITSLSKTAAAACIADGKLTVNISGGTSPYQYSLNNINYFSSNAFSNLAAGTYKAYVKDARGCTATLSDVLTKASALVITSVSKTAATACKADGKLTINASGGSTPYQYSLNNVNYFTSNLFINLAAGTYKAYIKDARGCTASLSNVVLTAAACKAAARSIVATEPVSSAKLHIKAFPNPSAEQFSIMVEGAGSRVVEIIITDLAGRKILRTRTATNDILLIGKELRAGTYIIEAWQGREKAILKVVKGK